jgi:hypothetical protein
MGALKRRPYNGEEGKNADVSRKNVRDEAVGTPAGCRRYR